MPLNEFAGRGTHPVYGMVLPTAAGIRDPDAGTHRVRWLALLRGAMAGVGGQGAVLAPQAMSGSRAQQSGQQHQAKALHGCRQHAPDGPGEDAGAAGGGPLGRRPLIGAWSAGHESGAHSHPWGVGAPRLREARGSVPFGLPADWNPGAASSFGERSRRRGPRARGGAELGRGFAGAEAAGGVRGAPGPPRSAPGRCPGLSRAPRQSAPA